MYRNTTQCRFCAISQDSLENIFDRKVFEATGEKMGMKSNGSQGAFEPAFIHSLCIHSFIHVASRKTKP